MDDFYLMLGFYRRCDYRSNIVIIDFICKPFMIYLNQILIYMVGSKSSGVLKVALKGTYDSKLFDSSSIDSIYLSYYL